MKTKTKKIITIIAAVLLVAVLATVFVACNRNDYRTRLQNKKYSILNLTREEVAARLEIDIDAGAEWTISAQKNDNFVYIACYKNAEVANNLVNRAKGAGLAGRAVAVVNGGGFAAVIGDTQAVKDALDKANAATA